MAIIKRCYACQQLVDEKHDSDLCLERHDEQALRKSIKAALNQRHKWATKTDHTKANSATQCVKCGMVRQWVGGYPTYFLNDNVWDKKAPPCIERKKAE